MAKRIAVLVVVAAALVGGLYYSQVRPRPAKVSGFVEADEIRLGSRVGGRAAKILVAEGDAVKQGQVLVELDPFDLLERQAEAAAAVAARNAEHQKLLAGYRAEEIAQAKAKRDELAARCQELEAGPRKETIAAARARLAQAKAEANFATGSLTRIRDSIQKGVATPEELDRALNMVGATDAAQAMRQAELDELEAGTRRRRSRSPRPSSSRRSRPMTF
jgi:HlyD family secretion protein